MGDHVATQIVEAIADFEQEEPTELDFVLNDFIDTDSLQQLLEHPSNSWTLTFEVSEYEVTLSGEGVVAVEELCSKP